MASSSSSKFPFQFVVVTFPDAKAARSASKGPLEKIRQTYPSTKIIASSDPYHCRVGSGGGTFNALEEILHLDSANTNDEELSSSILILHAGGASSRCPSQMVLGKAWTSIPCSKPTRTLQNPLLLWFRLLEDLFQDLVSGSIVVIASDTILDIQQSSSERNNTKLEWSSLQPSSVVALSVPASLNVAKNHGVFVPKNNPQTLTTQRTLSPCLEVHQKPTINVLKEKCAFMNPTHGNDTCNDENNQAMAWIDTGVICFLPMAARALKNLLLDQSSCQLLRCTKNGLLKLWKNKEGPNVNVSLETFSSESALSIDLYTHILNALRNLSSSMLDLETYCTKYNGELGRDAASLIYNTLNQIELIVWTEPFGSFLHLGTTRELIQFLVSGANQQEACVSEQKAMIGMTHAKELGSKAASRLGLTPYLNSILIQTQSTMDVISEKITVCQSPPGTVICDSFILAENVLHIGKGTVIEHSFLFEKGGSISIGNNCLVSCLRTKSATRKPGIVIPSNIMVQEVALVSGYHVLMVLGVDDAIKGKDRIYGRPFDEFLAFAGLMPSSLWNGAKEEVLWHAKIHPVCLRNHDCDSNEFMDNFSWLHSFCCGKEADKVSLQRWKNAERISLAEIRQLSHAPTEFGYRTRLSFVLDCWVRDSEKSEICDSLAAAFQEQQDWLYRLRRVLLTRQDEAIEFSSLIDQIGSNSKNEWFLIDALRVMDEVIVDSFDERKFDICGRALYLESAFMENLAASSRIKPANYADGEKELLQVLIKLAAGVCDHSNVDIVLQSWSASFCQKMHPAVGKIDNIIDEFQLVKEAVVKTNITMLSPFLTTAAEELARVMTRICVVGHERTASVNISCENTKQLVLDRWVLATAPARIDLAGGWSDTPPICFDHGSAVTGLAVSVDGKKPLACRSRLIQQSRGVSLVSEHRNLTGELLSSQQIELSMLNQMEGYNIPSSTCALLKSALVVLGIVTVDQIAASDNGNISLSSIVATKCDFCGSLTLQVVVTSILPHGSGMGSSSVLAGCVLASIAMCLGKEIPTDDLMQHIITLEQELTTGGGFQDQVNGLIGGAKIVSCAPLHFPVALTIEPIVLDAGFQQELNDNLVLVFTGHTRLAKNILQQCLRRWATRNPAIVNNVEDLIQNAHTAKHSLLSSSSRDLGFALSRYWEQKKIMAGEESGVEPAIVSRILSGLATREIIHGGSLCGAGGGGFLVILKRSDVKMPVFISALEDVVGEESMSSISVHRPAISDSGLTSRVIEESKNFDAYHFEAGWLDA